MTRTRADIRSHLEAIAAGKAPVPSSEVLVPASVIERHQADFRAWARFATETVGEPLTAPSEILAPLP